MKKTLFLLFIAASFSAAYADDFAGDVPDRVWIDFGGAYNNVSTQISVTTPNGVGAAGCPAG